MERNIDTGWSGYTNKHIRLSDGFVHRIVDAYGEVGVRDPIGWIKFACTERTEKWKSRPSSLLTEAPVDCLGCLAAR